MDPQCKKGRNQAKPFENHHGKTGSREEKYQ